jgi:hypothetical protein
MNRIDREQHLVGFFGILFILSILSKLISFALVCCVYASQSALLVVWLQQDWSNLLKTPGFATRHDHCSVMCVIRFISPGSHEAVPI